VSGTRTSPAMITRLVVASVSQAMRTPQGFNAGFGGFAIHQINDFVGNPVTDLVWMTFGNGFARKQVVSAHAGIPLKEKTASDVLVILPRIDKDTRT
jgi:hypothetical protein